MLMRTIVLSFLFSLVGLIAFGQSGPDVTIVKPLANFNIPDGGYYRDYIEGSLNNLYCGAEIQNIGDSIAYNTFLEVTVYNDDVGYEEKYYSDTVESISPDQTNTIQLDGIPFDEYYYTNFAVSIRVVCDSSDVDLKNNLATIPSTTLRFMWANLSRTDNFTGSLKNDQEIVFQSGDFIGFTLFVQEGYMNFIQSFELLFTESWPQDLGLTVKMYKDNNEVYSREIAHPSWDVDEWYYSSFGLSYGDCWIDNGHEYFVGVEMNFPEGTELPIGIDTSWHHNFEAESIARINGEWVSLPYVPVMRLVCNPEGIDDNDDVQLINIYPNPATDHITIDDVQQATIFDATGRQIASKKTTGNSIQFTLSDYFPGVYFVKAKSYGEQVVGRFIKQ